MTEQEREHLARLRHLADFLTQGAWPHSQNAKSSASVAWAVSTIREQTERIAELEAEVGLLREANLQKETFVCQCEGCKGKDTPAVGIVIDTQGVEIEVCRFHYECAIENGWRDISADQ